MYFNDVLATLMGLLFAGVQGAPKDMAKTLEAGDKTYDIVDLTWNLQVNGDIVPVTGTVQDMYNVLAEHDAASAEAMNATLAPSKTNLAARSETSYTPTNFYCNLYDDAKCGDINHGISYLNSVSGNPSMSPGPGECSRVSCSYNAAIWWCNDNAQSLTLSSFSVLADGAQQVENDCTFEQSGGKCKDDDKLNGQQFYSAGFNVIVRGASC